MIVRVIERVGNVNIQSRVVRVVRVYDRNIPSGITVDTLTEAGSLIVASAASTPSETGAPTADNQAWVSDLAEPLKGRWQAVATSAGGSIELTNKSGSNQVAGTVVIIDKANDNAFTTTTNLNDHRVVGVLEEDIDNNAAGQVAVKGRLVTVKVQGNVTRGYWLVASATAGRAAQYGTLRPSFGGIGIALTSYSGGGAGTVEVLVDIDIYSAFLQIAVLGTAATGDTSASTLSVNHTLSSGSNRIALAFISCAVGQTVTGVTYGGVAMTRLGTGVSGGSERLEIYYLLEASMPANGTKTVTVTLSGSAAVGMHVCTYSNVSQSAPSTPVTNSSASASSLSADVSVVSGAVAISLAFSSGSAYTFTHGTGQTELTEAAAAGGKMSVSYEEASEVGTATQSSTASGSGRMLFMATVIEPA